MAILKQTTNTAGDSFTPEIATQDLGVTPPQLPPSPAFMLMFHPNRWKVLGGVVQPRFGRLKLQAGVNRVREVKGRFVVGEAKAHYERRGFKMIPFDVEGDGESYLRKPEGTAAHVLKWKRTYSGTSATTWDHEGYADFIGLLRKKGIVKDPPLHILHHMRTETTESLGKAQDLARSSPSASKSVDAYAADLEAIEAEIKKQTKKATPKISKSVTPKIKVD